MIQNFLSEERNRKENNYFESIRNSDIRVTAWIIWLTCRYWRQIMIFPVDFNGILAVDDRRGAFKLGDKCETLCLILHWALSEKRRVLAKCEEKP